MCAHLVLAIERPWAGVVAKWVERGWGGAGWVGGWVEVERVERSIGSVGVDPMIHSLGELKCPFRGRPWGD